MARHCPPPGPDRLVSRDRGLRLRAWVSGRGIAVRIARKGVEVSDRLGRHRWVTERTMAWLTGYRRLTLRYERNASHFLGFLTLAATITCYKKLTKLTT